MAPVLSQALLRYLEEKLTGGQAQALPTSILQLLLSFLADSGRLAKEDQETLARVTARAKEVMRGPEPEAGAMPAAPMGGFSPEVENEANAHFQRVYAGSESLEDLMQVMARSASSASHSLQGLMSRISIGLQPVWHVPGYGMRTLLAKMRVHVVLGVVCFWGNGE